MSTDRLYIERRKKVVINLNIAPLIDIVFQLLLFFALTSYFVTNPGIEVSLPRANSAITVPQDTVEIYITHANTIYCNATEVKLNELKAMLTKMADNSKTVVLKADETVQLGLVVKVIDVIKQTKIKNLVIGTSMDENKVDTK